MTRVAEERPERPFLIHEEDERSYGDLEAASNRIARVLTAEGLEVGDRVGLLAENSIFYVEAYYGILKAGGVVVALNTAWDGKALASVLRSCGARTLVASGRFARQASSLAPLVLNVTLSFLLLLLLLHRPRVLRREHSQNALNALMAKNFWDFSS